MVTKSHVGIQSTEIKDSQHPVSTRWDCIVRMPRPVPVDSYRSALIFFLMCGRQASVFTSNYCRNTLQQPSEFKPTGCYSFTFLEIRWLNSGCQKDGFSVGELREESLYSSTSKRHSLSMTLTVPAYPFYCHILQMANQQPWLSNLFVLMFSI